jgi:hypothetical protein
MGLFISSRDLEKKDEEKRGCNYPREKRDSLDLRDLFALRIEENRADQAVPHSPPFPRNARSPEWAWYWSFKVSIDLDAVEKYSGLRLGS